MRPRHFYDLFFRDTARADAIYQMTLSFSEFSLHTVVIQRRGPFKGSARANGRKKALPPLARTFLCSGFPRARVQR